LTHALAAGGFDENAPCFISWLGVTQYLTREASMQTLRWAGGRPSGSEIVLTFMEAGPQAESLKASSAQSGVPFRSFFSADDVTAMLQEAGFSRIEHLTPAQANERYFQGRTDGLKAPEIQRLVSAMV